MDHHSRRVMLSGYDPRAMEILKDIAKGGIGDRQGEIKDNPYSEFIKG
jgi:hypothetical protein